MPSEYATRWCQRLGTRDREGAGGKGRRGARTDVPALREEDTQHEEEEEGCGAGPAVGRVGDGFVEVLLVDLVRVWGSAVVLAENLFLRLW